MVVDKLSNGNKDAETDGAEANHREFAFNKGKAVARIWIKRASYQEIKDVMRRSNARYDANYFEFMRKIFFASLVNSCPAEAQRFQNFYNDSFMCGWREGVISLWKPTEGN
jgi:hypothetical protein